MELSSTNFKVFGMTQPGIEPRSLGPLAETLPTLYKIYCVFVDFACPLQSYLEGKLGS